MSDIIDHSYHVETPEGIQLHAELAGIIPRTIAFSIDAGIRLVALIVLGIALAFLGKIGGGLMLIIWFLIEWGYPVFFEVLRKGQTPGKKAMGLVVFNDDLTPVNWRTSTLRNLLRAVDMLPIGYLFGATSMVMSRHFQRIGDLVAGTVVIHQQQESKPQQVPDVAAQLPAFELAHADRRALIKFVQRSKSMSPERAEELAALLTPVTARQGKDNVNFLYGIGNWLLGARPGKDTFS